MFQRATCITLSLVALCGTSAVARPSGDLTFTKGFIINTVEVTGAAGKTTFTMQYSFNNQPFQDTSYTGSIGAGGTGSTWDWNASGFPYSGDRVRADFHNGFFSSPSVATLGNVDIQNASIACTAGSPQTFAFPLTLTENFASNLQFGTVRLVPGSTFTIGLPDGFSWASSPSAAATNPSDLTVSLATVNGRDLNVPISSNNGIDPFAGFHLTNSLISFSGNSPGGANPFFTLSGTALYNGSSMPFSVQWQPVSVVPTPASIALLGLGALAIARRRR